MHGPRHNLVRLAFVLAWGLCGWVSMSAALGLDLDTPAKDVVFLVLFFGSTWVVNRLFFGDQFRRPSR